MNCLQEMAQTGLFEKVKESYLKKTLIEAQSFAETLVYAGIWQ